MADDIQEKNKNVKVKALDENKLQITANSSANDKVTIDFLGIEINGDSIIIEQILEYDENGIGSTRYTFHVKDNLFDTTIDLSEVNSKIETAGNDAKNVSKYDGATLESNFNQNLVVIDLDILKKSKGHVIIKGLMGYENSKTVKYALLEQSNGKGMFANWSQSTQDHLCTKSLFWNEFDLNSMNSQQARCRCGATFYEPSSWINIWEDTYININL